MRYRWVLYSDYSTLDSTTPGNHTPGFLGPHRLELSLKLDPNSHNSAIDIPISRRQLRRLRRERCANTLRVLAEQVLHVFLLIIEVGMLSCSEVVPTATGPDGVLEDLFERGLEGLEDQEEVV